ncbi:MAG: hypothetical protein H7222_02595 [Methylotenera sp.]|nr:hypothetical protein [Oligoflexia bacterium]
MSTGLAWVALVAEDDIFRQQLRLFYRPMDGTVGMKTESLCLETGRKYSIKWSIYSEKTGDYWNFINHLRHDWDIARKIEGSFIWFNPDDILAMPFEKLRSGLESQKVKVANMLGGWVDPKAALTEKGLPFIGFGTAVILPQFEDFRFRIEKAIRRLKNAQPGIQVLVYFNSQRDSSPGKHLDSRILDAQSRPEFTDWQGSYSRTWSLYPTLENSYGQELLQVVSKMRALGADGLYWDEMESVDYSGVRTLDAQWDGFSCRLDADSRVISRIAYVNLLSESAKLSFAQRGGVVMANSPPTTRKMMQRKDLHMVETQHIADWSAYSHLTTPLAFIGSDDNWLQMLAPMKHGLLPVSVRLGYSSTFFSRLYPFTVQTIHEGRVLGKEKIVTLRSGSYGWLRGCEKGNLAIYQYDSNGRDVSFSGEIRYDGDSCVATLKLGKNEAVILERISSTSEDDSETPTVSRVD